MEDKDRYGLSVFTAARRRRGRYIVITTAMNIDNKIFPKSHEKKLKTLIMQQAYRTDKKQTFERV